MRVLVTGSRNWEDRWAIYRALDGLWDLAGGKFVLIHGHCPTGADRLADEWGRSRHGVTVERHPADWTGGCRPGCPPSHRRTNWSLGQYCPKAGHYRNQDMVDLGADVVLAFQRNGSAGTQDCIDRARAAGLTVVLKEAA